MPPHPQDEARSGRRTSRRSIGALSWAVLAVGLVLSLGAGVAWKGMAERREADAFDATASNVQNVVATQLDRQEDLLRGVVGMVRADPELTNGQFAAWYESAEVADRYPGNVGVGYIARVSRDELPAFAARQEADPVSGVSAGGPFEVLNADSDADELCLLQIGLSRVTEETGMVVPPGIDFCTPALAPDAPSDFGAVLDAASVTAGPAVLPLGDLMRPGTAIEVVPVFAPGPVPEDGAGRRAATLGWVIDLLSAPDLIAPAIADRRGISVAVDHLDGSVATRVATGGDIDVETGDVQTLAASSDGRWTVTVAQRSSAGLSGSLQGLVIFVVGAVITLLVFALVRAIGGSRDRAMALVEEKTEELARQALHDELTGLPNRALLVDRAERLLTHQHRYGGDVSVLFLDLDNFKGVNDSLGHGAGDAYLRAIAGRLQAILRETDTIGRLGGDEFVVLMDGESSHEGAAVMAGKVLDALGEPIDINGVSVPVSCSIGIASGPCASAEALLHDADLAMYQAKQDGKGRYVVFEPGMRDNVREQLTLGWELRDALATGGLRVDLRPLFDLRSGREAGFEADLRWVHPTRGVLQGHQFIPAAWEMGLIPLIGRWSIREACSKAARELAHQSIAVKVSDRQFADAGLVDTVYAALAGTGLDGGRLTIEVNERALTAEGNDVGDAIRGLKALGVRIAVDDFGAGHTSMSYLRRFPIDAIKVDRALIAEVEVNPESRALVRTLVQMGDAVGIAILAEGEAGGPASASIEQLLGGVVEADPVG